MGHVEVRRKETAEGTSVRCPCTNPAGCSTKHTDGESGAAAGGQGIRMCTSNKFQGDVEDAGPGTTL